MATDRQIPTSASPDPVTGDDFMDLTQEEITGLWNYASVPLTITGGTANNIVGTLSPPLTDGWQDGMRITFIAGADNDDAMTVSADGEAAVDLVDGDGTAAAAGRVLAGNIYEAIYVASLSELRILGAAMPSSFVADYQVFDSSGIWTKPAGLSDNALVLVECIGGGGGGGSNVNGGGGGGGSGPIELFLRGSDLGPTETVTIAAGGAVNAAGGNTTFGSLVTAFGGGGGNSSGSGGGGGGGAGAAGGAASSNVGGNGGGPFGGAGGSAAAGGHGVNGGGGGGTASPGDESHFGGGESHFGGGGGGGGGAVGGGPGGKSVFGGGGGAGNGNSSGGTSIHGGNGGGSGIAGSAPGGGGGRNAVGAAGRCIVRVIG